MQKSTWIIGLLFSAIFVAGFVSYAMGTVVHSQWVHLGGSLLAFAIGGSFLLSLRGKK